VTSEERLRDIRRLWLELLALHLPVYGKPTSAAKQLIACIRAESDLFKQEQAAEQAQKRPPCPS
jgi:hypothetical protein